MAISKRRTPVNVFVKYEELEAVPFSDCDGNSCRLFFGRPYEFYVVLALLLDRPPAKMLLSANKKTVQINLRRFSCYCLTAPCEVGSVSHYASASPSRNAGSLATVSS